MGSLAKNLPSTFCFFDFDDVFEDIAGKLCLDPEADVDKGQNVEQVFMVWGGGSPCEVVCLWDLDSEDVAFDESWEVDGITTETLLV